MLIPHGDEGRRSEGGGLRHRAADGHVHDAAQHMMIGSRAYMSPQLYKGERADAGSNIWAIGVTLYELLAYRRPFLGDSEAELKFHIIYENPEDLQSLLSECTEELAPTVSKMLEKKSEDRYQWMGDVLHAIEPIWKAAQQSTVSGLLADC